MHNNINKWRREFDKSDTIHDKKTPKMGVQRHPLNLMKHHKKQKANFKHLRLLSRNFPAERSKG